MSNEKINAEVMKKTFFDLAFQRLFFFGMLIIFILLDFLKRDIFSKEGGIGSVLYWFNTSAIIFLVFVFIWMCFCFGYEREKVNDYLDSIPKPEIRE